MQWISNNLPETLLVIGIILMIVEVAVLGFSTFFLFFIGLGALSVAVLLYLGILPHDMLYAMFATAILSALYALLLWRKLGDLQSKVDTTRAKSDLIGHQFILPADISPQTPPDSAPSYAYSGIQWKLQSTQTISSGEQVIVVQVDVGVMTIEKLNK